MRPLAVGRRALLLLAAASPARGDGCTVWAGGTALRGGVMPPARYVFRDRIAVVPPNAAASADEAAVRRWVDTLGFDARQPSQSPKPGPAEGLPAAVRRLVTDGTCAAVRDAPAAFAAYIAGQPHATPLSPSGQYVVSRLWVNHYGSLPTRSVAGGRDGMHHHRGMLAMLDPAAVLTGVFYVVIPRDSPSVRFSTGDPKFAAIEALREPAGTTVVFGGDLPHIADWGGRRVTIAFNIAPLEMMARFDAHPRGLIVGGGAQVAAGAPGGAPRDVVVVAAHTNGSVRVAHSGREETVPVRAVLSKDWAAWRWAAGCWGPFSAQQEVRINADRRRLGHPPLASTIDPTGCFPLSDQGPEPGEGALLVATAGKMYRKQCYSWSGSRGANVLEPFSPEEMLLADSLAEEGGTGEEAPAGGATGAEEALLRCRAAGAGAAPAAPSPPWQWQWLAAAFALGVAVGGAATSAAPRLPQQRGAPPRAGTHGAPPAARRRTGR